MEWVIRIFIFTLGLIIGSFYNVCIYRIPEGKSVAYPPSHCPNCKTQLRPKDLIPVLSYLISGRKCSYCKKSISSRYAIVEFLTGLLFIAIYNVYGFDIILIQGLVFISLLIIITFIDLDHYIIPDGLIIIGSTFAILFNLLGLGISVKDSIFGGLICGGSMFLLIYLIELIVKKEVMGGGDIKLFAMIGLFLGINGGLLTILLSIYVGAIYGIIIIVGSKIKKKEYNSMIPYGPFIAVGALITMLYGADIINCYLNLLS